jgi:DNA-binding GntR family transcriptional regulator
MARATRTEVIAEPGRPAKDVAYDYVRREILWDERNDARFLAEETVGQILGVSRTPVREAFLRLEAEGLLTLVPRKGAMIVPITEREIREVMDVRSVVESWSARRVMQDEASLRRVVTRMRAVHSQLLGLSRETDPWAFVERDREFHRELVVAARNHLMLGLYERLRDMQLRLGVHAVLGDPERVDAVNGEHGRIVEAVASGDVARAESEIGRHLEATAQTLRARVSGL